MNDSERFERAIDKLLADESPRSELFGLDAEEQSMVRMAQILRGSRAQGPGPEFVESLRERVLEKPVPRVSRRTAFLSGLGALAAGLVAGVGLDRSTQGGTPKKRQIPLVGANGKWTPVAQLAEVPDGAIKPFTAGSVQGFLVNRNGELRALSRICTHMGCTLNFQQSEDTFLCPCHNAEFDLQGRLLYGRRNYRHELPPLPPLQLRVRGQAVEVWSV